MMEVETARNEAHAILDRLPETKVPEAWNYLKVLSRLSEEQIEALEEWMESLGWSILASEVARDEWE
jgi:hypothetical protein